MSPSQKKARAAAPPDGAYTVTVRKNGVKALNKAPPSIRFLFDQLLGELAEEGPVQPEWDNYSQLFGLPKQKKTEKVYHCHIAVGQPTYVAVWRVFGTSIEIEVTYAGTHGKAPY